MVEGQARIYGAGHAFVVQALLQLGECQRLAGRLSSAVASHERARDLSRELSGGSEHPYTALALGASDGSRALSGFDDPRVRGPAAVEP